MPLNEKDCSQEKVIFGINDLKERFYQKLQELNANDINQASVQSMKNSSGKELQRLLNFK